METPEEVLAVAMAGESSRMTILTPDGHNSPRIYGKEFSKGVVTFLFSESKIYNSDSRWGGLKGSRTHIEPKIRQQLDAGQRNILAPLSSDKGCTLPIRKPGNGLELMKGIHNEIKCIYTYVNNIRHKIESMSIGDCV